MNFPKILDRKHFKAAMISAVIAIAAGAVWLGYGDDVYEVRTCTSKVSKFVLANFSETSLEVDYEGKTYMDTDYWELAASPVVSTVRINEPPDYPAMPQHDVSMSRMRHFDNFSFRTKSDLTIMATLFGEVTIFSEGISKAPACLRKVGQLITVKDWYGITYGSSFSL